MSPVVNQVQQSSEKNLTSTQYKVAMTKRPATDMTDLGTGEWFDQSAFQKRRALFVDMPPGRAAVARRSMAVHLTQAGCVVIPGSQGEKRPIAQWASITQSSRPDDFTTDQMGILTGPSHLCVVDIDVKDRGLETWNVLVRLLKLTEFIRDKVPHEVTTTGGFHFYFANPATGPLKTRAKISIRTSTTDRSAGIDVRGEGGYVRCAPSAHISGTECVHPYITWVRMPGSADGQRAFPQLPDALDRVLRKIDVLCENADGSYAIEPAEDAPPKKKQRTQTPIPAVVAPAPHIAATEDPIVRRLVMECLSHERAELRDHWLRVLLALAYEDHTAKAEDRYLQLCKDFSRRTHLKNLASDEEIAKLYGKGFGAASQQNQPFTLKTVRLWAKEDNPQLYNELSGAAVVPMKQPVAPNAFDDSAYYWYDFCAEASARTWDSLDAFMAFCQATMPRVLAIVSRTPVTLITKHSADERCHFSEHLPDLYSCWVSWVSGRAKDGAPVASRMRFAQFLSENRMRFHCFKRFDVDPCGKKDKSEVFNIWPGLKARLLPAFDERKVAAFKEVLHTIWAAHDDSLYKYLLAWLRFLVANLDRKANVALVVTGLEGAGKSVLCEFLRDFVLGPAVTAVFDGVEDMVEKHNCRKAGRRLWVLDECRSTRDEFVHTMDSLKRLVTNPVVTENPKGLAIREVENIGMMIIVSNHSDCISVTTTDRRYTFVSASPEKRGPEHREWWCRIREQLMTQESGDHVYTWLMSLTDLPDPTVPHQNHTRAMAQHNSKPAHRLFVEERISAIRDAHWWISKDQFYQEYRQWCQHNGHQSVLTVNRFHAKVSEIADLPPEDLNAQIEPGDAPRTLSIQPYRLENVRGYASGGVLTGMILVKQPTWKSLEDLLK